MFEGPIVAAYELQQVETCDSAGPVTRGPIAGIAVALPLSVAMWASLFSIARFWF